ncbi:hypothetical protein J4G08_08165 [Candidatus Poribacteria bacterium]|nr:hypothetical protein [Candidatus Poribacteria bacterium]
MYLEFLPDGSIDCPLLIFSPSVPKETEQLYQALHDMVSVSGTSVDIHALPFISSVDGCKLSAQVVEQNLGVVLLNTLGVVLSDIKNHFTWKLTRQSWKKVLDLLHPFTLQDCHDDRYTRHQWLDETSNISVLISTGHRRW